MESHLATSQYARLLAQYPNFKEYIEMVAKLRATATMHGAGRVAGQMASPGEAMGASVKGNDSFQQHRHHYADETRSLGQLFEVLNPHARQMHRKSALVRDQERKKSMDAHGAGDLRRKSRKSSTRWNKLLRQRQPSGLGQHTQASSHPEESMRELRSFGHSVLGRTGDCSGRRDSQNSLASESHMPIRV